MSIAVIGGIDPTGGAGLVRDLWSIQAFSRAQETQAVPRVVAVPSAWTWQGVKGQVTRAQALGKRAFLRGLARAESVSPRVIKIGLVPGELVEHLVLWLDVQRRREPKMQVILDPVLRASDGGALGATVDGLWVVIEAVDLVTPNREEALALLGARHDGSALGAQLVQRTDAATSWLIKSAHAGTHEFHDELWGRQGLRDTLVHTRVASAEPRGTGCALASAIAFGLWRGLDEEAATRAAGKWLASARTHTRISAFGQPHLYELSSAT